MKGGQRKKDILEFLSLGSDSIAQGTNCLGKLAD